MLKINNKNYGFINFRMKNRDHAKAQSGCIGSAITQIQKF